MSPSVPQIENLLGPHIDPLEQLAAHRGNNPYYEFVQGQLNELNVGLRQVLQGRVWNPNAAPLQQGEVLIKHNQEMRRRIYTNAMRRVVLSEQMMMEQGSTPENLERREQLQRAVVELDRQITAEEFRERILHHYLTSASQAFVEVARTPLAARERFLTGWNSVVQMIEGQLQDMQETLQFVTALHAIDRTLNTPIAQFPGATQEAREKARSEALRKLSIQLNQIRQTRTKNLAGRADTINYAPLEQLQKNLSAQPLDSVRTQQALEDFRTQLEFRISEIPRQTVVLQGSGTHQIQDPILGIPLGRVTDAGNPFVLRIGAVPGQVGMMAPDALLLGLTAAHHRWICDEQRRLTTTGATEATIKRLTELEQERLQLLQNFNTRSQNVLSFRVGLYQLLAHASHIGAGFEFLDNVQLTTLEATRSYLRRDLTSREELRRFGRLVGVQARSGNPLPNGTRESFQKILNGISERMQKTEGVRGFEIPAHVRGTEYSVIHYLDLLGIYSYQREAIREFTSQELKSLAATRAHLNSNPVTRDRINRLTLEFRSAMSQEQRKQVVEQLRKEIQSIPGGFRFLQNDNEVAVLGVIEILDVTYSPIFHSRLTNEYQQSITNARATEVQVLRSYMADWRSGIGRDGTTIEGLIEHFMTVTRLGGTLFSNDVSANVNRGLEARETNWLQNTLYNVHDYATPTGLLYWATNWSGLTVGYNAREVHNGGGLGLSIPWIGTVLELIPNRPDALSLLRPALTHLCPPGEDMNVFLDRQMKELNEIFAKGGRQAIEKRVQELFSSNRFEQSVRMIVNAHSDRVISACDRFSNVLNLHEAMLSDTGIWRPEELITVRGNGERPDWWQDPPTFTGTVQSQEKQMATWYQGWRNRIAKTEEHTKNPSNAEGQTRRNHATWIFLHLAELEEQYQKELSDAKSSYINALSRNFSYHMNNANIRYHAGDDNRYQLLLGLLTGGEAYLFYSVAGGTLLRLLTRNSTSIAGRIGTAMTFPINNLSNLGYEIYHDLRYGANYSFQIPFTPEGVQKLVSAFDVPVRPPNSPALTAAQAIERYENTLQRLSVLEQQIRKSNVGGALQLEQLLQPLQERRVALIQQMLRERGILAPGASLSATQLELIHQYGTSARSFLLAERANAVTALGPTSGNFQVRFNGAFRSLASIETEISQMAIGAERTALEQFLRGRRIALIQQMCPTLNLRQALTAPVVTRIQAIFGTTQTFTTLEDLFHFAHARSCLDRAQIPNIIRALEEAGVPQSVRGMLFDTGAIGRSTAVVHPPHLRTTPPLSAATHAQVASRYRSFRNGLRNVARSPLGPGLAGLGLLLSGMESMSARISREEFLKRIDAELLAMHFTRSGAGENATYTNGSIVIRLQDLAGIQNARVYSAYANTGAAAGALFVELLVAAEGGGAAAGPIGWVVAGVCITVHIGTEAYQRSEGLSTIAALPPFILAFAPEQYLGSDPWQFVETTFFDLLRGGPNARNTQTDARDKALFGLYSLFLKQSHPEAWIDLIQKKTPSQLNDFYVDFLQQVKPMFIAFLLRDVPGHNYSNVSDSAFNTSYAFNRSHSREQIRSALESAFVFQYGEFLMQDYADRWRFYFNEVRLHGEDSANAQEALAFVHQMSNRIVFGQRLIYWFTYAQLQPNNQTRPSFLQRLEAGENPNTPAAEMRQQIIQRMVQDQIMPNGRVFAEQGQWQFVFSRQNLSLSIPRSGHNIFDEIDEQRARLGLPREMTETAESAVLALNDCSFNIAAGEGVQAAPLTLDNILSLPNGRHVPVLSQHFVEPRSIGPIPNEATAVYVHRISPDVQLIVCLCGSGEDGQILRYRTISRFGNAPWQTRTTDTLMQAPENNVEDAYLRQLTQLLQPSVGEATALLERQRDEARNGLISLTPSYIDGLHRMTYVDAQGVHQVSLANVPTGFGINNQNGALIFTMNTLRNPNFPNDFIAQNTYRIANAADVLALPNLVRDRILFLLTRLSYQQSLSAILFLFPLDQQNQMGGMTRSGIASRLLPLLSQMDEAQRGIVLRSLFTELHTYQQTGNLPQPGQFFGILQSVGSQLATFNVFGAQNAVLRGTGQPALKAAQELLATPAGRMDVIIQLALNGLSAKQIPMETWAMLYRLQHILSYRQSMPPYPNFSAAVQNGPLMNARHEALEKQGKELRIRLEQIGNSLRGPNAAEKLTQAQTDLQALWKEIQEREKAILQLTQDIQSTTKQNTESQQKEKAQNEEWSKALIEAVQRGPDGDPLQMNENTYLVPLGNNRAVILRLMPNGSLRFYVINGAQEIGINPVLFQNLDDEALYAENDPAHPMPPDITAARNTLLQRIAVSRAIQTLGNLLILQYPEGQEHLRTQLGQLFGQLAVQGMTALTFAEVLQKAVQNFMQRSNTTSITLNSYSEMQQFIARLQGDILNPQN